MLAAIRSGYTTSLEIMPDRRARAKVQPDGGVGADVALDRGVADVALVPQSHVFQRGNNRRAHEAGKAGQVFGQHGVALVGHGGRALLPRMEEFLRFAHFGALEVADFRCQPLNAAGDNGQARRRKRHGGHAG
jgi:hypothetical protein